MPIYEYRCKDCEQLFEEWQKGFDDKDIPCPVCGAPSPRIISQTSFVLKGGGWYVTDYAGKNGSAAACKTTEDKPATEAKDDAAAPAPAKAEPPASDSGGSSSTASTAG